jgi:hypothetical protein
MKNIYLSVILCAATSFASAQTVRYVVVGGAGNGTSWANASGDIQLMIDDLERQGGGQVWVARGTYFPTHHIGATKWIKRQYPDYNLPFPDNYYEQIPLSFQYHKELCFRLKNNVEVYGGFAGNETHLKQRDWEHNKTTLNGKKETVYNVVVSIDDVGTACLDGFTVEEGGARMDVQIGWDPGNSLYYSFILGRMYDHRCGGGISLSYSSPKLTNLKVTKNRCDNYGAGISARNSNSYLYNIRIYDNTADHHAGGIFTNLSNNYLEKVDVYKNTAESDGGGVYNEVSTLVFKDVIIRDNVCHSVVGGGMANIESDVVFYNVLICNNEFRNTAGPCYGGAIYNLRSKITLTNVTIADNTTPSRTFCGIYNNNSTARINNTIIWGSISPNEVDPATSASYNYSLVQNYNPGGTNLPGNTNPLFTATYELRPNSPCIDVGDNFYVTSIPTDLAGNLRIMNNIVDMGAYEFQGNSVVGPGDEPGDGGKSLTENNSLSETIVDNISLTVYPNPVISGQQIRIHLGNNMLYYDKSVQMNLYSIDGKLLYGNTFPNGNIQTHLPDLSAGMYLLNIQTDEGTHYKQKLMINW